MTPAKDKQGKDEAAENERRRNAPLRPLLFLRFWQTGTVKKISLSLVGRRPQWSRPPRQQKSQVRSNVFSSGRLFICSYLLCFLEAFLRPTLISWEEDKPFHESRVHLVVTSFLTPLMLWATFAVVNIIVRRSRRSGIKTAP